MLRSALAGAYDAAVPLRFAPPSPTLPEIARLLVERYGENAGPGKAADALEALLRRLRLVRYDWDQVDPADRLDVAWVLWRGATPPAEHEPFLRGFLRWIEVPRRRLQAARLAACWAAAFDPALSSIRIAGEWLGRNAAWLPDPWPGLAETYEIFAVENGPVALAEAFLAGEETAAAFFQRLRVPGPAAIGGLALAALAAAAAGVERRLAREPRLAQRLCALALDGPAFRLDAAPCRGSRRAGAIRRALAEALLLPWQHQAPPRAVRSYILTFLLRHYGDARVSRAQWAEMRPPAAAIMHRWLIEHTVTTYFRLVAQTKSAHREQLAERQAFWLSNIEQIDDAWLLAGRHSTALLGAGEPARGSLTGCRPDQTALLLRIGSTTILEASHAAGESVWLPGNPLAPPLYRPAHQPYLPAAFSSGANFSSAYGTGNDAWQDRLASFVGMRRGRQGVTRAA